MMIKLIVGLSNFGIEYSETRHNVGAWYIHFLAKQLHGSFLEEPKFHGFISMINLFGFDVYLLIPKTFMNISGKAVVTMANFHSIQLDEILIVHDEMNLPPGIFKFKYGGGHGGHNGLKDIIRKFENNSNFHRLRIGIGHPGDKNKVVRFVLEKPSIFEKKLINEAIEAAVNYTKIWIKELTK